MLVFGFQLMVAGCLISIIHYEVEVFAAD